MEELGFCAGDEVELRGLSKIELNGQRGTILPLEFPEQAKALGRLAVMLQSGKQLSLKVANLTKVQLPQRAAKTGGDLGEAWSSELCAAGKAMGLPLLRDHTARLRLAEARRALVVMTLHLQHTSGLSAEEQLDVAAIREASAPDVLCVQESLEGLTALSQAGFTKLISSAVKAQPLKEMLYGEALPPSAASSAERLLVNEIYIRERGTDWEVVGSGVEQVSSDLIQDGGGPLAVRSVVWARLRLRSAPEGPAVFLLNTQLSGGVVEERLFERHLLASERQLQLRRALDLCDGRSEPGDLGVLVGPLGAPAEQKDLLTVPFEVLKERGWISALDIAKAPRAASAAKQLHPANNHVALSRAVAVEADLVALDSRSSSHTPQEPGALPCGLCGVKASIGVHQQVARGAERAGLPDLPVLGFGTAFMPEDMKERVPDKDYRRRVEEMTEDAVMAAIHAGLRLFESANKHLNQQAVGRTLESAIKDGLVTREDLFLAGRISHCKDLAEVSRETDLMLRELRVDYVDLLIMDVPPERAPKAWSWLEEAYREGKARFLGATNFDFLGPKVCVEMFREFLAKVEIPPAVYAMEVHPFNTNEEMSECCKGLDIQVLAYSPLGAPHKIEAFMRSLARSDARDMRPLLKVPESPVLQELGRRHGATPAQVALRWNLQRGHAVVPKSFDVAHVEENAELFHFQLPVEEMAIVSKMHKGIRAERFFQQAYNCGSKVLPQMTRDAQDSCEAILAKVRGNLSAEHRRIQADLASLGGNPRTGPPGGYPALTNGKGSHPGGALQVLPPGFKGSSKGAAAGAGGGGALGAAMLGPGPGPGANDGPSDPSIGPRLPPHFRRPPEALGGFT